MLTVIQYVYIYIFIYTSTSIYIQIYNQNQPKKTSNDNFFPKLLIILGPQLQLLGQVLLWSWRIRIMMVRISRSETRGVGSLESETWEFPQTEKKQQRYLVDVQQYVGLEG